MKKLRQMLWLLVLDQTLIGNIQYYMTNYRQSKGVEGRLTEEKNSFQ